MNIENQPLENLESLYLEAKELYYTGESPLSDAEFDELEDYLKSQNSDVIEQVGFGDRNAKFPHISPMGSQAKFQATETTIPVTQTVQWMTGRGNEFTAEPKFDGNSINIIFKNGKLSQCLTRGTGTHGRDITRKMKSRVPNEILLKGNIEVRGEVVMNVKTFEEKYSDNKNPRNMVAGLLNRKDEDIFGDNPKYDPAIINDLDVMVFEIREDGKQVDADLNSLGFNQNVNLKVEDFVCSSESFLSVYESFKTYRETECPYQLDGMVLKCKSVEDRNRLGENKHHPEWSIAIKFPPQRAVSEIVDIEWRMGKTGELTPVAILSPTDLDGTTVRRASMHNYGYVESKKLYPGAQVVIAKKGDIIPQIIDVVKASEQSYEFPTHSPDGDELTVNGVHLICANENAASIMKRKLEGIRLYGVDEFGGATLAKLYDAGIHTIIDFFEVFGKNYLITSEVFKEGRELDILIEEFNKIKEVPLETVINSLNLENVGRSISKQIANKIAGLDYSFASLDRKACSGFDVGEEKRELLHELILAIEGRGIKIIYPQPPAANVRYFEMTGSPKNFGFKAKKDFIDAANSAGFQHGKLNKDATYLITDDLNSSSSKMKRAVKDGVEIITYGEFIERHGK